MPRVCSGARAVSTADQRWLDAAELDRRIADQRRRFAERPRKRESEWSRWKQDFERQRQRAHEARLAQIWADEAAARRREERSIINFRREALEFYRALRTLNGKPVPEHFLRFEIQQCVETHSIPDMQVLQDRDHLLGIAARERIEVSWDALPAVNAYAWASLRRVECPVVRTRRGVATLAHEIGHVLTPTTGGKVQRELNAWRWAMANTLVWDKQMHDCLRESLNTYRKHATPEEAREMDALMSPLSFHRERQRRAMVGVPMAQQIDTRCA
jgi:hypothetical protein